MRECWLVVLVVAACSSIVSAQDDTQEVAIIKQINRVNEDGTYTFGYEAADGSFKIETRDVLGNVKGMFGFIDENGELKRVTYTASNATGFQASGNIGVRSPEVTRKPVLLVRHPPGSITPTTRVPVIQHIPPRGVTTTTPDYYSSTTEYASSTTENPRPIRVLVTKRPYTSAEFGGRTANVIRRQLGVPSDTPDVYSGAGGNPRVLPSRAFRYPPLSVAPDPREVYRNMLLEQSNLKPDYPVRGRYYPPPVVEDDYVPDIPAVVPMVNRVLASMPPRYPPSPIQRYRTPIDDQQYQLPAPVSAVPQVPYRPRPYVNYGGQPLDYEALREEIMNYLFQYLEYRARRLNPYYQPYPYGAPGLGGQGGIGGIPPVGPYSYPDQGFYPRQPIQPVPPRPYIQPGAPPQYNLPFPTNSNVQYSGQQSYTGQSSYATSQPSNSGQSRLSTLKQRMAESRDTRDSYDTRPPSSDLIRMLLASPSTQRPAVRNLEIIGTAASTNRLRATTTSTTTSSPDRDHMIADS